MLHLFYVTQNKGALFGSILRCKARVVVTLVLGRVVEELAHALAEARL